MLRTQGSLPTSKVSAFAGVGALCTLVVMILNQYVLRDNPLPTEAAMLASTVLGAVVAYFVPPAAQDKAV